MYTHAQALNMQSPLLFRIPFYAQNMLVDDAMAQIHAEGMQRSHLTSFNPHVNCVRADQGPGRAVPHTEDSCPGS